MGKFLLDPVKFRYDRFVPGRTPETCYDLVEQWLEHERARKVEGVRPSKIRAQHGRRRLGNGWEPDAPKWLEFEIRRVGDRVQVEVWAYPTRAAQAGPYRNPAAAKLGYGQALQSLWWRFGFAESVPERAPDGRSWEEFEDESRREVRIGAVMVAASVAVLGGLLGFNVATGRPLVGVQAGQWLAAGTSAVLIPAIYLILDGKQKASTARLGRGRAGPPPGG